MGDIVGYLDQKFYAGYQSNWDDELFRERIIEHLGTPLDVLDLGAGAGIVPHMNFKGIARCVCGIDPDERVITNPYLDEGKVAFGENILYANESFDLIFADNVLEHLPQPEKVFSEVFRLLRPGGTFLAKTPNKWHYMPLIARFTPHHFHKWINKWRGRVSEDIFPTLYQANSTGDIEKIAKAASLEVSRFDLIEGRPEYLRMSFLTYIPGLLYERLVNRFKFLASFRILLIVELRKPVSRQ